MIQVYKLKVANFQEGYKQMWALAVISMLFFCFGADKALAPNEQKNDFKKTVGDIGT